MPILSALLLAVAPAPLPAAPPGAATLIVYRAYAEPILMAPILTIDDFDFGELRQHRFVAVALPPGKHHLEIAWPRYAGQRRAELDIVARAGVRGYVELGGLTGYYGRKGVSVLSERDSATAIRALACCRAP